jgi:hypothetical protein
MLGAFLKKHEMLARGATGIAHHPHLWAPYVVVENLRALRSKEGGKIGM